MGSDSGMIEDDSSKKHRRSSDGEGEETTKRRKHKHHHHRHHRHHHRSNKRDEEERVVEDEVEMEVDELTTVVADLKKDYDDMEEGEIVEEDGEKLEDNHVVGFLLFLFYRFYYFDLIWEKVMFSYVEIGKMKKKKEETLLSII